jgi:tetratricopeptide (TPR) repeat protein
VLVDKLRDARRRLDVLAAQDGAADLRTVFSWSYHTLQHEAARMFRLLGLHPGPDISPEAAASLAALDLDSARRALDALTAAHSISEHVPGRYSFHDLLRAYAAERALALDTDAERRGALRRICDFYLHTGHTADRFLFRALGKRIWEARLLTAVGWFAARLGDDGAARVHCQAALTLLQRHNDPSGEAAALDSLGYIEHRTGQHQQAVHHYQQALTLFHGLGGTYNVASTLDRIGYPHAALGQNEQARAVWQQSLDLYQQQGRAHDARRVRDQLNASLADGEMDAES